VHQRKRFAEGRFIKLYNVDDLFDSDWEERIQIIERIATQDGLIPLITFKKVSNIDVIYSQQRISRKPVPSENLMLHLERLAENLDRLANKGFVHGDISFKNLMFDGVLYRLIDLEPSLRQRRAGRVTLMYTPPYIALDDFEKDTLTSCTDKVGFYFFCRRMLCPIIHFSPLREMRQIMAGQSIVERFTSLPEYAFTTLNFKDILNFANLNTR